MKCCVPFCGMTGDNHPLNIIENKKRVTFHEFPTIPWLRKSWLAATGIREQDLPPGAVVCSQHFVNDNYTVTRGGNLMLRSNSIPSLIRVPSSESSPFNFCMICLDTEATKLYALKKNRLSRAYTNVCGYAPSVIRDHKNRYIAPKMCTECTQRLINCETFKNKITKARSIMIELVQKDKNITLQTIKSVNRVENQLTSNIVKRTFAPDHCDLYLIHDEEENSDLKSEKSDETMYESEKDAFDDETEYLNSGDQLTNKEEFNIDIINPNIIYLRDNAKVANNKDHDIKCDSDYDVEIKMDIDRDIDDDVKYNSETITVDNSEHDSINDFDIDDNDDEPLNDTDSNDRSFNFNKSKNENNSGNKVSLSNVIFVKDTRPIIQHKDDTLPRNDISYQNQNIGVKNNDTKCKSISNNSFSTKINETVQPNDNNTIIKQNNSLSKEVIEHKKVTNLNEYRLNNEQTGHIKPNNKIPGVFNSTSKDIVETNTETNNQNECILIYDQTGHIKPNDKETPSIFKEIVDVIEIIKQKDEFNINDEDKIQDEIKKPVKKTRLPSLKKIIQQLSAKNKTGKPKTQDCTDIGLKAFTRTSFTYDEQIAEIQNRKDTEEYKRAPYKCENCFKGFLKLGPYNRHMDKHTDKVGGYVCSICGIHTNTRHRLTRHMGQHSERYSCKQCDYTTNTKGLALVHERWHDGSTYTCGLCGATFGKSTSYLSHLRIIHPSDDVCPLCGYSFIGPKGVNQHMSLIHPFEDVQNLSGPTCEECDIRFASDAAYQRHMEVSPKHAVDGKAKRNEASSSQPKRNEPRSYRKRNQPSWHRKRYPGIQKKNVSRILCEHCGKEFKARTLLQDHMYVHTGVKLYKCDICRKEFTRKIGLTLHMTHVHNPTRYPCEVCHREFANWSNRKRHMMSHADTRPMHTCGICDKTFTTATGRDLHVSHVHFNVPRPKRDRRDRYKTQTHGGDVPQTQTLSGDMSETLTYSDDMPQTQTNVDYSDDSGDMPQTQTNVDYSDDSGDVPQTQTNVDYSDDSGDMPQTETYVDCSDSRDSQYLETNETTETGQ